MSRKAAGPLTIYLGKNTTPPLIARGLTPTLNAFTVVDVHALLLSAASHELTLILFHLVLLTLGPGSSNRSRNRFRNKVRKKPFTDRTTFHPLVV